MVIDSDAPAIILGNGMNNYTKIGDSWCNLLRKVAEDTNIDIINGITYPEIYEFISLDAGAENSRYASLKPKITKYVKEWKGTEAHKKLVDFARENKIPIITTNYDTTLLDDELKDKNAKLGKNKKSDFFKPQKIDGKKFTDYYPFCAYYSDHKIQCSKQEFGIWHIHGIWYYKRSLIIGLKDYIALSARISSSIFELEKSGYNNWKDRNSVLYIFLHNDLFIIGLKLGSEELSIRSFLIEREKYFRRHSDKRRKTTYVLNKKYDLRDGEEIDTEKEFFFSHLNGTVRYIENSEEIYDSWEINRHEIFPEKK